MPEDDCRALIKKQFVDNNEVETNFLKVSMKCNLTLLQIQTPARGRSCKHISCFSLESFVDIMNKTHPRKWRCPVCKLKCFDIVVDGY